MRHLVFLATHGLVVGVNKRRTLFFGTALLDGFVINESLGTHFITGIFRGVLQPEGENNGANDKRDK
jgi:hypothetical protein